MLIHMHGIDTNPSIVILPFEQLCSLDNMTRNNLFLKQSATPVTLEFHSVVLCGSGSVIHKSSNVTTIGFVSPLENMSHYSENILCNFVFEV